MARALPLFSSLSHFLICFRLFKVLCSANPESNRNLKDLCLVGSLGPEVGKLVYLKSIILRNNSFSGSIPKEVGKLKELEVLDLGCNNFSGPFPRDFCNNLSLGTLLLDNNEFLGSLAAELLDRLVKAEIFLTGEQLNIDMKFSISFENIAQPRHVALWRRLQQLLDPSKAHKANKRGSQPSVPPSLAHNHVCLPSTSPSPSPLSPFLSPLGAPFLHPSASPSTPTPALPLPAEPPVFISEPPQSHSAPANSPASTPSQIEDERSDSEHHMVIMLIASIGGSLFVLVLFLGIFLFRSSKVVTVKPWATGLSGQLRKAFVTGVPKLKRSELEAACEDFSNIIGTFSEGTVYKGTLSSGVEIAVTSTAVASREDWSKNLETHFRNKIEALSKVNHKNFVNLIGYCEENVPFTRMMYKKPSTWTGGMRLRIAMGIAYCLEHMHQLTPPIAHRNLQSSSMYLTEDYAAKISDFSFLSNATAAKAGLATMEFLESQSADAESNIYSFGVILFEMITGRIPYSIDNGCVADWASDYLKRDKPLKEMMDLTLKYFQEDEVEKLFEVIKTCVNPDPKERPTMREIAANLKEITAVGPEGATPKLSPLWWAELEILSTEAS
ncbi:hypothetical protein GOBAR_AA20620 [Gossypium barbadense]|uniref:Protein kinase domain-containing protein n=1 Tax=Gossypium barbadense TaxID=3634 RepID=A0A2P5X9P9_GOSBA|nr:hypothetical protein GOBAR_AA20620 [Gossypium barbadense]